MSDKHMACPIAEYEAFPLDIEDINIDGNYVLFKGGLKLDVETYLSLDEVVDEGHYADSCIVEHPAYGWIQIDIEPDAVTIN